MACVIHPSDLMPYVYRSPSYSLTFNWGSINSSNTRYRSGGIYTINGTDISSSDGMYSNPASKGEKVSADTIATGPRGS